MKTMTNSVQLPKQQSQLELEKYLPEKGTITTFMSRIPSWRQHLYCKNIFNVSNYYRKMHIFKLHQFHEDIDLHCFNDVNSFIDTDTLIKKSLERTDLPGKNSQKHACCLSYK